MTPRRTPKIPRLVAAVGLCLAGCTGDGSNPPTDNPGQLGRGSFQYVCVSDDDPTCPTGSDRGDFPTRFAVGGRFRLGFTWKDDAGEPLPDLRPASPGQISQKGEIFTVLRPGYSSILAVHGNSDVADFLNLFAADPAVAGVQRDGLDVTALYVAEGEELDVRAVVRDDDGIELAGTLAFTWQASDDATVEVLGASEGRTRVRGKAPGAATLTVTHGTATGQVTVEVIAAPATTGAETSSSGAETTATTDATDTGDAGTDTGSSSDSDSSGSSGSTGADTTGGAL